MHDWNNNYDRIHQGPHIFMMIFMIAVLTLLAYAIITYLRGPNRGVNSAPKSSNASAQAILNERLARGEISEDEFKSRSEALKSISQ
jgi:putative membrane protein